MKKYIIEMFGSGLKYRILCTDATSLQLHCNSGNFIGARYLFSCLQQYWYWGKVEGPSSVASTGVDPVILCLHLHSDSFTVVFLPLWNCMNSGFFFLYFISTKINYESSKIFSTSISVIEIFKCMIMMTVKPSLYLSRVFMSSS